MVLGITGGVGCGKSTLLSMLEKKKGAKVILADNLGHEVMEPGTECYEQIVTLLGSSILDETGHIKREKMAQIIRIIFIFISVSPAVNIGGNGSRMTVICWEGFRTIRLKYI